MFKRILATTALLGVWALPLAAQGHAATAGTEMTITGSVVDLNCNTTNGPAGAGPKACAPASCQARPPPRIPPSDRTPSPPGGSQPGRPPKTHAPPKAPSQTEE